MASTVVQTCWFCEDNSVDGDWFSGTPIEIAAHVYKDHKVRENVCDECTPKTAWKSPAVRGRHAVTHVDGGVAKTRPPKQQRQPNTGVEAVIGKYLDALATQGDDEKPRSYYEKRLEATRTVFEKAAGIKRLHLAQEIRNFENILIQRPDITELEEQFVTYASNYAKAHAIDYMTFRDLGVPARVLKAAEVTR